MEKPYIFFLLIFMAVFFYSCCINTVDQVQSHKKSTPSAEGKNPESTPTDNGINNSGNK